MGAYGWQVNLVLAPSNKAMFRKYCCAATDPNNAPITAYKTQHCLVQCSGPQKVVLTICGSVDNKGNLDATISTSYVRVGMPEIRVIVCRVDGPSKLEQSHQLLSNASPAGHCRLIAHIVCLLPVEELNYCISST